MIREVTTSEQKGNREGNLLGNKRERAMWELSPPIQDAETNEITFWCVGCKEKKTAPGGTELTYFFKETLGCSGESGWLCPSCSEARK